MKKIFALLFLASAVLSSCSSDSDNFSGGDNNIKTEKYPVNFSIKSQAFEVDKSELKSFKGKQDYLFQVVVYKEDGKPYLDSLILAKDMQELLSEDGSLPLTLQLPEGEYHLSFMYSALGVLAQNTPEAWALKPKDYATDTYGGGLIGTISVYEDTNVQNYYQTMNLSVSKSSSEISTPLVLEPMWSEVRLTIKDASTFKAPIGANYIRVKVDPAYRNYGLQSKLALYKIDMAPDAIGFQPSNFHKIEDVRKEKEFTTLSTISKTLKENNSLKIRIQFYSYSGEGRYSLITEHIIDLKEQVENGFNYKLNGSLGNAIQSNDYQWNLSLEPIKDKDISFE